jgi:hypothetical protein
VVGSIIVGNCEHLSLSTHNGDFRVAIVLTIYYPMSNKSLIRPYGVNSPHLNGKGRKTISTEVALLAEGFLKPVDSNIENQPSDDIRPSCN